ncbi:MAG: glycosyltransferase [Actinomycetota bacterium]|nr:glycosyltransferase [Actinomycetota bacterium]
MSARIAVISYHSSPLNAPGSGDSGGMTVYVRELSHALARLGFSTDIFTRAVDARHRVVDLEPGVRVVCVPAGPPEPVAKERLGDYVDEFVAGIGAFATFQRLAYDVVHSHYWQSGLAAKMLVERWGTPFVHSHHTLGLVKNRNLAPGDLPESQDRVEGELEVISEADVLVASTDDEWGQLSCLYGAPHDRIKTIHPGVDHDLFSPGDRKLARDRLGLSTEDRIILSVGRIQPLKGLELAVRAVEQLVPALEGRVVLQIVGGASGRSGDDEIARLRALAADLGVEKLVRFEGPRPHEELPAYYRAADVLAVCSHYESFGLVALEAHASGTPVVATAVGGLSHIVRDEGSGFLIDTRDPAEFAARLKTVLSDPSLLRRFGREAQSAAASFSWDETAGELADLYHCLVSERQPEVCTCQ